MIEDCEGVCGGTKKKDHNDLCEETFGTPGFVSAYSHLKHGSQKMTNSCDCLGVCGGIQTLLIDGHRHGSGITNVFSKLVDQCLFSQYDTFPITCDNLLLLISTSETYNSTKLIIASVSATVFRDL